MNKLVLVNCTPHQVTICAESLEEGRWVPVLILDPSGTVARVKVESTEWEPFCHYDTLGQSYGPIPVFHTKLGEVIGLPPIKAGVLYLVSLVVREAARDRNDLVSPGELIRDEKGQPIGCKGVSK